MGRSKQNAVSELILGADTEVGIDHVILTSAQMIKCFALGLQTECEVETELGRFIMPSHLRNHVGQLLDASVHELACGTPYWIWVSRNSPSRRSNFRGNIGLTIDLSGILGHHPAWGSRAWIPNGEERARFYQKFWPLVSYDDPWGNDLNESLYLVEEALPLAVDCGEIDKGIAPIVFCMRRCMSEYTEVGSDLVRAPKLTSVATPTESTLPDFCIRTLLGLPTDSNPLSDELR